MIVQNHARVFDWKIFLPKYGIRGLKAKNWQSPTCMLSEESLNPIYFQIGQAGLFHLMVFLVRLAETNCPVFLY